MNTSAEPKTIGAYELLEEIGHGSMGRVWRARRPGSDRDFAVKISEQPGVDTDRGERRRRKLFFNEVKAAEMLNHPNIVSTVDAGVDEGRRYIVMEYVPGACTLADFAVKKNLLPVGKVLQIMSQCAEAFNYAHSNGVVHRDIKPTNIMIDESGAVKIGDFGVALIDRADVDETQVMGRIGSPRYMSPEQILGSEVTNQSDIYSLGVVTYELLTGVSPFSGKHVAEIARKVIKEPHRPVRELNPDVPEQLAMIIDRTLKKHPAGRYATAMDLAADLQLIQEDMAFTDLTRTDAQSVRSVTKLSCFYGFDTAEVEELLGVASWEEYESGEVVAIEGIGDASVAILVAGRVQVMSGQTRVTRLGPGTTFGDFALVESGDSGAEIKALEKTTVLRIGASQVEGLSPGCARGLYHLLASGFATRLQQIQRRIARRVKG